MPVKHVKSEGEYHSIINKGVTGSFGSTSTAVIVDFSAAWCGPCQAIAPIFERLSDLYTTVVFIKVDVDELNEVAAAAGVRAMPTFHTYLGGVKEGELQGANPQQLEALIKSLADKAGKGSAGTGHKLGGGEGSSSSAAAGGGSATDMRARLAAAAEARAKAAGA